MEEKTIWGIHASKAIDGKSLFLNKNIIALGWYEIGDFEGLSTREDFKEKYAIVFPEKSKQHIATSAGQLYRFKEEIKIGDIVVFLPREDRQVYIGEIAGDYLYDTKVEIGYPNQRKVKWIKDIPRTSFSQGAIYEMGSAMSLFQIKNYADEIYAALEGEDYTPELDDDTVALVAEDIEEQSHDFIIKQLERNLKGLPLEEFILHLLITMGYRARLTRKNEPSVDIIAHKDKLGFEPPIIKVQVKSSTGTIGDRDVSALYGKVENSEFGLLVTLGVFSPAAWTFSSGKSNLRLIDGNELVSLIIEHYDDFNSKYKGIIPLKQVYIPQAIDLNND